LEYKEASLHPVQAERQPYPIRGRAVGAVVTLNLARGAA